MRTTLRRPAAALAALALSATIGVSTADAHVSLTSTSPKAGSTAKRSLSSVTATFSGPLRSGTLKVTGPQGQVSKGSGARDPRNVKRLRVALRGGLKKGTYRATWSIRSADGHVQSSSFTFKLK